MTLLCGSVLKAEVICRYVVCKILPSGVPRNFFSGGGQQIQLRTEDRGNEDLGAVAP